MNLDSIGGQGLFGVYGGSILADGSTVEINNVNNFVIDKKGMMSGELKVTNGGTLKINNVDTLINKDNTFSASIKKFRFHPLYRRWIFL